MPRVRLVRTVNAVAGTSGNGLPSVIRERCRLDVACNRASSGRPFGPYLPHQYGQDVGTATAVSVAIGSLAVAEAMTAAGGTLATLRSALTRCWPASLLIAEIEFSTPPDDSSQLGIGKSKRFLTIRI